MATDTKMQDKNNTQIQDNEGRMHLSDFDLSEMLLNRYKVRTDMNNFELKQIKSMLNAANFNTIEKCA